ncbi:MAG: diguanylate cyclase [Burkholderiales bacterium RIFCSPLOWO2_12_FULL_61_40]|nr:MAG: diguanylate cyclase [Burkholderiales bacterium RIFCSPLOWO2_12_FULL_61_40]
MAKILVVDDQAENRALVVALVNYRGHQALEAADGAEALAIVRAEHPNLVFSDILMPTMDGYEFVRRLRADPAIADTEVIFYSAHYLEREAHNLARDCGVSQVLMKPCDPEDILIAMDRALLQEPAPKVERASAPESAQAPDVQEFDRDHLRLLTNKLSEKVLHLEAANRRLDALTDFNLQLASERDPLLLLEKVCKGARELIGAQYAVVCVRGKPHGKANGAVHFFTSGIDAALVGQLAIPDLDRGALGATRSEGRARRMVLPDGDATAAGMPPGYPPMFACLMAPVASLSYAYGWICLADKLGNAEFSDEDERILFILAAQVGRIYENGSLLAEVQRYAEDLRESEAGLHHAQLLARLTHVISGPQGMFQSWPDTMPQMIGVSPERMVKSTQEWLQLVHPDDRALFQDKVLEVGAQGERVDFEYRLQRQDGVWLHIRQVMEPISKTASDGSERVFHTMQDITEQKRVRDERIESERRFKAMLGNMEMVSLMLDCDARITYCNDYLLRLSGWAREEVLGRNWFECFIPPEREDVEKIFDALLDNKPEAWHYENEIVTRSGARRLVRWNNTVLRSSSGEVIGTASVGEDITDSKEAERKIIRLNRVLAVLSGINTLIIRVHHRDELFQEACRIAVDQGKFKMAWIGSVDHDAMAVVPTTSVGADPAFLEVIQHNLSLRGYVAGTNNMAVQAVVEKKAMVNNDLRTGEQSTYTPDRIARGILSMAFLPILVAQQAVGVLALYSDEPGFFDAEEQTLLSELAGDIGFALDHIEKEERLNYLAYYDELTGLPNRPLFLEQVSLRLRTCSSDANTLALALVDIDRFQIINETLGRQAGDELLKLVAQRIQQSNIGFETVACVGINCFGVVLCDPRDVQSVAHSLEQLLHDCFAQPFHLRGSELRMAGKVGVALYPQDGDDPELLYRHAETALKRARGSVESLLFYSPAMNTRVAEALNLESRLRTALEQGQFVLYYQPKVSLVTGKLTSLEALIRWNDPQTGLVPPAQFIPILEETGLIYEVGRWALHQAIADNQRWRRAGIAQVRVAVNVSSLQLRHRGFIGEIRQAIGSDPQTAAGLELEITESMIMEDVHLKIASLQEIRDMGVTIAIDDFGTGFSSLSYLSKLPVDTLKIDRSFVIAMTDGPQGLALVSTIIGLAHALKLKVVAEGVETEEQAQLLRLLNCDEMQGYLFSKPLPRDILETKHFLLAAA